MRPSHTSYNSYNTTTNNIMEESLEVANASFWLPTNFLTDDDLSMTEFQNYDSLLRFGSDPFDSPVSSTDDAFLLSHLTRKLSQSSISEKQWGISTSPQSTLTGFGRSGLTSPVLPSPPVTPEVKNDVGWEVLYEAAGQVARLKMNSIVSQMNNGGLISTPSHTNNHNQEVKWAQKDNCNCRHHYNHQPRRSYGGWPSCGPQVRRMNQGGPGCVGSNIGGVKRQTVGTGVFLPRRVSNSPPRHHHHHQLQRSEPWRKPIGALPERVAQPLNMEFGEANINSQSRFLVNGFTTDQADIMLARRNVILEQQRWNITRIDNNNVKAATVGPELRLPNDWSY